MCHWRRVRNVYLRCGHAVNLPEELVTCASRYCKFSPYHPSDCANCTHTCIQYRTSPELYSPQVDRYCPGCNGTGRY